MITPAYIHTMARYNSWQNRNLVSAAATLNDEERNRDAGAFFGSIQGTLSHLLWGDTIWMSRFDGGPPPDAGIPESPRFAPDWDRYLGDREAMDDRICQWADGITEGRLAEDLTWHSGALGRDVSRPLQVCVTHFFNHQTHHRGQVHALLTRAGSRPSDTDLFMMPGL